MSAAGSQTVGQERAMSEDDGKATAAIRIEADSLGEVEVPARAYWGAQTQRSIGNFPFGAGEAMPIAIIHALALIKQAAARVNIRHGLDAALAEAIGQAAAEVASGRHDREFPLSIWQSGSGTQSHMNVNEVIAGRANELLTGQRGGKAPVHPNDHVNRSQSSNDSFPTALHIAAALTITRTLQPALARMQAGLEARASQWAGLHKIGRTHLQDATPLTLGQEFSGYAEQLARGRARIDHAMQDVLAIAQGGTAVGTGLNAPQGFGEEMAAELSTLTGLALRSAPNKFEAIATCDALVALSAALSTLAGSLNKIANDIRLLGSGPRAGLAELVLPANEPGSSIMPGKVNPTQCEMLTMIAAQVIGNHAAVTLGGMQGQLELNTFRPMIGSNVLRSIGLLTTAAASFTDHLLDGLQPDARRIGELLDQSLMLVTALVPEIGYETAARIVRHAQAKGLTLRDAVLEQKVLDEASFERLIRALFDQSGSSGRSRF
jgi:fumarate hydratase class II